MILKGGGRIYAVPELDGKVEGVDMSHEAAVGKIARGRSRVPDGTRAVRGGSRRHHRPRLHARGHRGLPPVLAEQIDHAIELSEKSLM